MRRATNGMTLGMSFKHSGPQILQQGKKQKDLDQMTSKGNL